MASSSEDLNTSGALSTDDENLDDNHDLKGKKKGFKPMKALKSLFTGKKRKRDKEGNVSKAKSTSALVEAQQTEQSTTSSPLNGNRCMSEDSVFSPDTAKETDNMPGKKSVSLEVLSTNAGLKADLFARIQARNSDEGFYSPLGSQNMDAIVGGGLRPGMSTESENSLMSYGSSSDDEFFNTSWKVDALPSVMLTAPEGSSDLDLDAVSSTSALRNDAALHKRSVRPKTRRASSFARPRQAPALSLPSLKEESPARDILEVTDGAKQPAAVPAQSEQQKENKDVVSAAPKTKPKPARLSLELKEDDLPKATSPGKSPTTPITMSMIGEVKLRQNKSTMVASEKAGEETDEDTEISKAFGKLRRKSQENADKSKDDEAKNSELAKIFDLKKRKSSEVDDSKVSAILKDSKTEPVGKEIISVKSSNSTTEDNEKRRSVENKSVSATVLKTKTEKTAENSKPVPDKSVEKEPKIELGSVKLRTMRDDSSKVDIKPSYKQGSEADEKESEARSLSERMSVFGAPLKVRKAKLPDRRSKTVEVEKLPSSMTKESEGSSPRLTYSKSFQSGSRETSPTPKQRSLIHQQSGKPAKVVSAETGRTSLVGSRSKLESGTGYQPSWVTRKQQAEKENEETAKNNSDESVSVKKDDSNKQLGSQPITSAPSWKKTEKEKTPPKESEKPVSQVPSWKKTEKEPTPSKETDKPIGRTPSWKKNDKEPSSPKQLGAPSTQVKSDDKPATYVPSWKKTAQEKNSVKTVEIVDNKKPGSEPAWKANLRERKTVKETGGKAILIEDKALNPSELKSKSLGRNVKLGSPEPKETVKAGDNKGRNSPEKSVSLREHKPTGSIRLQSGEKAEKAAMARKSKVMDLMKNFQAQELANA